MASVIATVEWRGVSVTSHFRFQAKPLSRRVRLKYQLKLGIFLCMNVTLQNPANLDNCLLVTICNDQNLDVH